MSHIMSSRFDDLISLNSKAKSLSKESVYPSCATPRLDGILQELSYTSS
jgi:hypothetical protein